MKREELNGKTFAEVQELLEQESVLFQEELKGVNEVEEVMSKENDLIEEMKEYDKYLDTVSYNLEDSIEYDLHKYTKNEIAAKIVYFLNKTEVEWQYTLGMYELVKLWKNRDLKTIKYKEYDSTLRCLNLVKFKGYQEWQDILAINEYLSACHEAYTIDTAYLYAMSDKHNAIMNRVKELDPESIPDQPMAVEPQCI